MNNMLYVDLGELKLSSGWRWYYFVVKGNTLPDLLTREAFECMWSRGLYLSKKAAIEEARSLHLLEDDGSEKRVRISARFEGKEPTHTDESLIKMLKEAQPTNLHLMAQNNNNKRAAATCSVATPNAPQKKPKGDGDATQTKAGFFAFPLLSTTLFLCPKDRDALSKEDVIFDAEKNTCFNMKLCEQCQTLNRNMRWKYRDAMFPKKETQ